MVLNPQKNNAQTDSTSKTIKNIMHEYAYGANSFATNVPLNEISSKAFKDFSTHYSTSNNEKWFKTPKYIMASFKNDSIFYKVYYSKRGSFLYSYKYYDEKKCQQDLKEMLQYVYPEFHILNIVELYEKRRIVYGINLTNDAITKTVELDNGELKTLDEFQNQKDYSQK
jgi:hypothetical protein